MALILKSYIASFIIFLGIDMIWLGLIAKNFYANTLGHLMSPKVLWFPAIVFYMIFVAGILFFVVFPAIQKGSWLYALGAGALFGLITYATYDLTNLATLKDWPVLVTIIDLCWGSFLSASVSILSYFTITRFFLP
jgi:uncharacterized membrane protein